MLGYVGSLDKTDVIHVISLFPYLSINYVAFMAPIIDEGLDTYVYPLLVLGPVMTDDEHEHFSVFIKMKQNILGYKV